MTIANYIKDRLIAYLIGGLGYLFIMIFMLAFKVEWQLILVVTVVCFMTVISHEVWNLLRKKAFYDKIQNLVEELDKKNLMSAMLKKPSFYEGKMIYESLCAGNKSMTEQINVYKRQTKDFKEFIEMWVHEAKIPVASLRLINHNNPGAVTEKINVQLKRVDDCIDNVLYFARSENAEKDYIIKEVSLKKIFSSVAVKNRETLGLINGSISTDGLDTMVLTDGKWLEFILGQLMANSIKYSARNRTLELKAWTEDFESSVILHFRDNGIGISESDQPYIFEKTFTGNNGRLESKSTGMGLYIVKNMCDRLGHSIDVVSEEGLYTEFKIGFARDDYFKMR
ncbi:sensor histidine kinase [Eubacterium xylanophilum]|uniref:sensor histidine kinase n=1 Tax=Eubacterium xylanophilum TaxID=39497 RepID=UPI00047B950E|nr:sensor histidine kinase [Eubacterium xylanophilum]